MTVTTVVLLIAVAMMVVERVRPGRAFPTPRTWWLRAIALNLVQIGIVFLAGSTFDRWFVCSQPRFTGIGGAIAGYLVITFVYYWWHRARHESELLWRWLHQLHHSAQRIEILTSFYKHPIEQLANGILSSAIVYGLVGLDVRAATIAVMLTGVAELFYHWNIRTPYWLGFIVQRPESHLVHHQEGLHTYNFSDLPLWDILFGTFRNPRAWNGRCGFAGNREENLLELLGGRVMLLIVLGVAQMTGDVLHAAPLKLLAMATGASPAPRVFTAFGDYEPYSSRFFIEWPGHRVELTPEVYSRLRGPYNRRNVYGAAMAGAPIVPPQILDPVMRASLCNGAPLLRELGFTDVRGTPSIVIEPLHGPAMRFTPSCR